VGIARKQYEKGLELARAELRENPRSAVAHASAAYIAAYLGDKKRAEDEIGQALRLAHDDNRVIDLAVITYEVIDLRSAALAVLEGATPEILAEMNREPDLAAFCRDSRFKELVATANKGENK
jgi:tetratricopeptide (TPR) repeat protein